LQLDKSLFLITERTSGGKLTLVNSQTGEISDIHTGIQNVADMFKLVKSPKFSVEEPEIYFSVLLWGDLSTPRSGRQAAEPAMRDVLPSGLSVYRGTLDLETKQIKNLKEIYKQSQKLVSGSNYGGALAFSKDGKHLFVSVGDQGDYFKPQQLDSEVGEILRLNLDGSVPIDNPYLVSKGSSKIFARGFRNVYGLVALPSGTLMGIDHGPLGGDELNIIRKSGNYGWVIASEGVQYTGEFIPSSLIKTTRPSLYWADAVAPSAISLVSSQSSVNMRGDVLVSTLKGKSIFRIRDFLISSEGQLITLSDGNPSKLSIWPLSY